jgi:hypothetical protein
MPGVYGDGARRDSVKATDLTMCPVERAPAGES